jgi:hypothetical protein
MTKHGVLVGFAVAAVVALGSLCSATDRTPHATQPEALDGVAAAGSRPLDEAASRVRRLTASLEQSRAAAGKNPLLFADVGYYEAELAAIRSVQIGAIRQGAPAITPAPRPMRSPGHRQGA